MLRKHVETVFNIRRFPYYGLKSYATRSNEGQRKTFFDDILSKEEKEKILFIFNTYNLRNFEQLKMLTPTRARNIVEYRVKNGNFDNLSEFLNVPGLGPIALTKICTELRTIDPASVLNIKEKKGEEKLQCYPRMNSSAVQRVDTVCSLCVLNDSITYSHLDRDLNLLDWNQNVLFDKVPFKYDHLLYQEKVMGAVQLLPKADVYVMEEKRQKYTSLHAAKYQANNMVLFSMMATLINKDYPYTENKVYIVNEYSLNRVFEMNVGSERMSCINLVNQGFKGEGKLSDVKFPEAFIQNFTKTRDTEQFLLGSALLVNVGFFKYCILSKSL